MGQIIKKLNPICQGVLSSTYTMCEQKEHFFIEIEHFLFRGLMSPQTDFQRILKHYEIDISTVLKQLSSVLDHMKTGNRTVPLYSPHLIMVFERAWYISSVYLDLPLICSSSILMALVDYDPLRGIMLESCPLLLRIPRIIFRKDLPALTT